MSRLADSWFDEACTGSLSFPRPVFTLPCFCLRLLGIGLLSQLHTHRLLRAHVRLVMVLHTGREYNELLFSLYVCGFKVALKRNHYLIIFLALSRRRTQVTP